MMTTEEFNDCVDLYADPLYRFTLKGARDSHLAQDIVQDSFSRLWERRGGVERAGAKGWLFKTAFNAMIDRIRHEKFRAPLPAEAVDGAAHGRQYSDLNEALHAALEHLPAVQRAVVLLRDYEGYSYDEIGGITGLGASQVKVYIYRARMFLRRYIGSPERLI